MPTITIREALTKGLKEALDKDPSVFIMGEDIGPYGGAYAVTKGFLEEYGAERIKDTPIAESVMVGAGTGAAMGGMKPVVELMTINFGLLAMDQIVNHAEKIRYMSGGQFSVPLIIRAVTGGGGGLAATHSQCLEGWFASVPGLKVATPATPYDALGLLRSSFEDNNPILFAEHALIYGVKGEVPEDYYTVPFGKAETVVEGSAVSLIAYSRMVHVATEAAAELAKDGISCEVIDIKTLRPFDIGSVADSVRKTNRAVVVEEAWKTGGFGAEIASQIQEVAFEDLDGPILRVCGEEVPQPYNKKLEAMSIPDAAKVVASVKSHFSL